MNADSNADKGPGRPAAGRMAALSDRQRNAATSGVMAAVFLVARVSAATATGRAAPADRTGGGITGTIR